MKTLISASLLSLGLFVGAANAADVSRSLFMDINDTAPNSATFAGLATVAPQSSQSNIFVDISRTAPRHDNIFRDLQTRAP